MRRQARDAEAAGGVEQGALELEVRVVALVGEHGIGRHRDRAHAAELRALRLKNESLERALADARTEVEELRRQLDAIGGFAGMFRLPTGYTSPVLVSCTDGVGTKLLVAIAMDQHETVGVDLVAMSVNDLVVTGAEPLFVLDYIATGKLAPAHVEAIVAGVCEGCRQSGASPPRSG